MTDENENQRPTGAPGRITRYHTASGSVYEVEVGPTTPVAGEVFQFDAPEYIRVRRVVRSDISRSERVSNDWRDAESVGCLGVGMPLVIWWGRGRDEHSANAEQIGFSGGADVGAPDDAIQRCTQTTPVKHIEILGDAS